MISWAWATEEHTNNAAARALMRIRKRSAGRLLGDEGERAGAVADAVGDLEALDDGGVESEAPVERAVEGDGEVVLGGGVFVGE